ncbi:MAG: hypothetical protein ACT4PT_07625, partial [Methanobacteriota archaeon]
GASVQAKLWARGLCYSFRDADGGALTNSACAFSGVSGEVAITATLPATGTYYLVVDPLGTPAYRFSLGIGTAAPQARPAPLP